MDPKYASISWAPSGSFFGLLTMLPNLFALSLEIQTDPKIEDVVSSWGMKARRPALSYAGTEFIFGANTHSSEGNHRRLCRVHRIRFRPVLYKKTALSRRSVFGPQSLNYHAGRKQNCLLVLRVIAKEHMVEIYHPKAVAMDTENLLGFLFGQNKNIHKASL